VLFEHASHANFITSEGTRTVRLRAPKSRNSRAVQRITPLEKGANVLMER
jgi:hypothetical protein